MYDPEATIQDADIEMAELARIGNRAAYLRKRGICTHSSSVGVSATGEIFYTEQVDLFGEEVRCTDICGKKFASAQDMYDDAARYI